MDLYGIKRSVGMAVVLSIVTCGIYALYWLYQILSAHYRLNDKPNGAGMDIVLGIITCGIYSIYLMYKLGKLESETFQEHTSTFKDESVLYLILAIFGLSIVVYAIAQSNLNNLPNYMDGSGTGGTDTRRTGFGYGPDGIDSDDRRN